MRGPTSEDQAEDPPIASRLGARLAIGGVGLVLAAAIVVIAVAMGRGVGGDETGVTAAGFDIAPDFTVTTLDGETVAWRTSAIARCSSTSGRRGAVRARLKRQ